MTELSDSIIAILAPNGIIAGTGFLVAPDLALTCAHVIEAALSDPGGSVRIRFHRDQIESKATVDAEIWSDQTEDDIALLHLTERPASTEPLLLTASSSRDGMDFKTFGYPTFENLVGVPGEGKNRGRVNTEDGRSFLLLRSDEIDHGNSGGPVVDPQSGLVFGMVRQVYSPSRRAARDLKHLEGDQAIKKLVISLTSERDPKRGNALATPSEALVGMHPGLKFVEMERHKEIIFEIERLMLDNAFELFKPLFDQILMLTRARPPIVDYVFFSVFLNLIRQMKKDIQAGESIGNVLNQAISRSGKYSKPDWDPSNIFQRDREIFNECLDVFRKEIIPSIEIDIVLLVMNSKEAEELKSGQVFVDSPVDLLRDYENLNHILNNRGLVNWEQNYKNRRQDWHPWNGQDSINDLITYAFNNVKDLSVDLVPNYVDLDTILANEPFSRKILQDLRRNGCFLIMDTISMRHPKIQYAYSISLLDAFQTTMVAKVAPFDDVLKMVQRLTISFEQRIDFEFHKRQTLEYDGCCFEVTDSRRFLPWFFEHIKYILPDENKPQKGARRYFFNPSRGME